MWTHQQSCAQTKLDNQLNCNLPKLLITIQDTSTSWLKKNVENRSVFQPKQRLRRSLIPPPLPRCAHHWAQNVLRVQRVTEMFRSLHFVLLCLCVSEAKQRPYYADYSPVRLSIHSLCTSHYLDLFITFIICINVFTMSIEHYNQPQVIRHRSHESKREYAVITGLLYEEGFNSFDTFVS